nr:replicase protein [Pelargonium line pattern virus]
MARILGEALQLGVFAVKASCWVSKELALLGPNLAWIAARPLRNDANAILERIGVHGLAKIPCNFDPDELTIANDCIVKSDRNLEDESAVVEEIDEGEEKKKSKKVTRRRVKTKPTFAAVLAADAKNYYGCLPSATRANELSVMKYLVSKCQEHKLTITQTREVSAMAFALTFTPDENDKLIYKYLNSTEVFERRVDYAKARGVDKCWFELLKRPWHARAWRRVVGRIFGMPEQQAFEFVK